MEKEYTLSLRERKHAQTKIALAEAVMERLKTKRLKDISVKEVCETIPVSEVTFYNYFPKKTDVLVYILQLWRLEMEWHLMVWEEEKSNLEVIEAYFDFAAQGVEEYPGVMAEALAYFTQKRGCVHLDDLSSAEKILAFPELPGIEEIQLPSNPKEKKMLGKYVSRAIEAGELPSTTDIDFITHTLDAYFIGSMLAFHNDEPVLIRPLYRKMLNVLWKGLWQGPYEDIATVTPGKLQMTSKRSAKKSLHDVTTFFCNDAPDGCGIRSGGKCAPMAVVSIGGIFSSTFMTLYIVPALYSIIEGFREYIGRRHRREADA